MSYVRSSEKTRAVSDSPVNGSGPDVCRWHVDVSERTAKADRSTTNDGSDTQHYLWLAVLCALLAHHSRQRGSNSSTPKRLHSLASFVNQCSHRAEHSRVGHADSGVANQAQPFSR